MFNLHLDLQINYVPPMNKDSHGIRLTREIQLPFAPSNGLIIFSQEMDDCPEPEGFTLKDVIWDIDRRVFLAWTELESHGVPLVLIPDDIRGWLDRGWQYGSYRDAYTADLEDDDVNADMPDNGAAMEEAPDEWDEAEKARLLSWRQRRAEQNRVFKALIRHMAETHDNTDMAYAIDKTGRYFDREESEKEKQEDPKIIRFAQAAREYRDLNPENRDKWHDRVARYPSLEKLVTR